MAKEASRGYTVPEKAPATDSQPTAATIPGGGGYGGGYNGNGYRGGNGKTSTVKPEKEDKETPKKNLGDIYGRKTKDLEKQTKAGLQVIKDKQKANNALLKEQQKQIQLGLEYQPNIQREQSTLMALRNRMGNAAYGSSIVDLMEGMGRVDDMNDNQLISTYKQNMDNAYNNWFQADTELVGDYNEALNDADQKMSDLLNQYQAALNNIDPIAAKTKNILKADKAAGKLSNNKAAVKGAKNALAAAKADHKAIIKKAIGSLSGNERAKYQSKKAIASDAKNQYMRAKNALADMKKGGNAKEIAAAQDALKAAKDNYRIAKDDKSGYLDTRISKGKYAAEALSAAKKLNDAKSNLKKANSKLSKSKKSSITVGKGDDKVTIPKVKVTPTTAFSKLLKAKQTNADPRTQDYIRPNYAAERFGGANGTFNTAPAANNGFSDNLRAFRRV